MSTRTLGEAVEEDLVALEKIVPDTGALFRKEFGRLSTSHSSRWRLMPEVILSGVFAEFHDRIKAVLAALPKPQADGAKTDDTRTMTA